MLRLLKGQSILGFKEDYLVLDIETTDFDYFDGGIIEIAVNRYQNYKLVDSFQSLVKPPVKISSFITKLTGITNKMVEDAPALSDVLKELDLFIKPDDIIIGHNVNFDVNFIYDAYEDLLDKPLSNDFIDTLRLARRLVKDSDNHKLATLASYFDIITPEHRALADVLTTQELYLKLKEIYNNDPVKMESTSRSGSVNFEAIQSTIDPSEIDKENYFYNLKVCFTGRMDHMTKKEAAQTLVNKGALVQNNIYPNTNLLVLGNLQYQHHRFGKKSSKHLKAEKHRQLGQELEIMTEITFLEIIEED